MATVMTAATASAAHAPPSDSTAAGKRPARQPPWPHPWPSARRYRNAATSGPASRRTTPRSSAGPASAPDTRADRGPPRPPRPTGVGSRRCRRGWADSPDLAERVAPGPQQQRYRQGDHQRRDGDHHVEQPRCAGTGFTRGMAAAEVDQRDRRRHAHAERQQPDHRTRGDQGAVHRLRGPRDPTAQRVHARQSTSPVSSAAGLRRVARV